MQNTALENCLVLTVTPIWLVSSELHLKRNYYKSNVW